MCIRDSALAKRQMDGFGGIISIDLNTDLAGARRFLERCDVFALAESLGGVEGVFQAMESFVRRVFNVPDPVKPR